MRKENKDVLVLCDMEEEYATLMTDFIKKHKELPWTIRTYTTVETLMREEVKKDIAMLVVAESSYTEEMKILQPKRMIILNESGLMRWTDVENVNKYQCADMVLRDLLELYMDIAEGQLPKLTQGKQMKIIGIYSPIRRCQQTTFALTMSQLLADRGHTLYLNFEQYVGISELLPDMQTRDMADLLYFLSAEKDKFRLRMQAMIQHIGKLDYIPPMKSGQNLLSIPMEEWLRLLQKIIELGDYEYIILDLSESMQGLFDILRTCCVIFTLTQNDRIAQSKLVQYEQVLSLYEYDDVLHKTCRCSLPRTSRIPQELEQYTKGELAEYVREQLKGVID